MKTSTALKKFWYLPLSLLSALVLSPPANANLIVNGSFEADPFTANGNYEVGLVGNDVTGWFIPNGDGVYPWGLQNGAFGASTPFGNQWIVLGRWNTGSEFTIQQTLNSLVAGETYALSFAIASELGCCSQAEVSFLSGSSTAPQLFTAPSSGLYWTDWASYSMNFVANSSSVTLQFKNVNPTSNGFDLGLDNVSVIGSNTKVPETSGLFGLLAVGFLGVGSVLKRKLK
jgi:hypothetical protein